MATLRLAPRRDLAALAEAYARDGVVRVPDLLAPDAAEAVAAMLDAGMPWELALSDAAGKDAVVSQAEIRRLGPEGLRPRVQAVIDRAQTRFAYIYLVYPMIRAYLENRDPGHPVHALTEFLNGREFLEFGQAVTGEPVLTKADAQATWYRPGDFLTLHDDAGVGERRAAYTLGFTRAWRADWGGQLLFHGADDDVTRGLCPAFNTLTLFKVPTRHSVAPVAAYAGSKRLSIAGWLRDDPPVGRSA